MEIQEGSPDSVVLHRLRLLGCFFLPLVLSLLFTLCFETLRLHQAEDYLSLAVRPSRVPSSLFRPPGYIAFLHFINAVAGPISNDRPAPIYIFQDIVLSLATVAWYLTARRWMTAWSAWWMALAFGCNPLMIVLAGYIHYDILHTGLCVLAGLVLVRGFASNPVSLRWAGLAGLAVGVLTLVRPMTLVMPAFLALALCLQTDRARQLRTWLAWAAFSLALVATIAPRTWNIYARTGHVTGVNVQFWLQVWTICEEPIRVNSENIPGLALGNRRLGPVIEKELGASALQESYGGDLRPLIIEMGCRDRVLEIFRTNPWIYLSNVVHNALFFLTGDSRMRIRTFIFYQYPDTYMISPAWTTGFFIASSALLHLCGVLGLALGLWRRNPTIMILASLFICLWIVHSMVYLDYHYIYSKFPFMLWFTGYLVSELHKISPSGKKTAACVSAAFALFSLLGTVLLIF